MLKSVNNILKFYKARADLDLKIENAIRRQYLKVYSNKCENVGLRETVTVRKPVRN